jgi:hypothetical protein
LSGSASNQIEYWREGFDLFSPDDVFRLDPKIRWTALAKESGEVVFNKMRPGFESYTSEAEDKAFMELGPLFMISLAERLTPSKKAGAVKSIVVNLEKDSILLTKVRDGYLAVSAPPADANVIFPKIVSLIQQLAP